MMSDQEITSVIGELEGAIADLKRQGFIPGLGGILEDAYRALVQIDGKVRANQVIQNLPTTSEAEIILIHGMDFGTSGVTSCCGLPPFELPSYDRVTLNNQTLPITCKGPKNV